MNTGSEPGVDLQPSLGLSIAIITLNEEENLKRCLESISALADRVVVVDSGSTDNTCEIARVFGARVSCHEWSGYSAQKNLALSLCTRPWVLSLDADEAVSPELTLSIQQALQQPEQTAGFFVSRRTWYMGDWLRHCWYPEWRLRLVKRTGARWSDVGLHETLDVPGQTRQISGDLLHYSYKDLADQMHRSISYARIGAAEIVNKGVRFQWQKMLFSPLFRFAKILVAQGGWRDGWRGWIIAWSSMYSAFLKYAFVYEATCTAASSDDEK